MKKNKTFAKRNLLFAQNVAKPWWHYFATKKTHSEIESFFRNQDVLYNYLIEEKLLTV